MLIERYWMSDHVHRLKVLGHTGNSVCGLQEKSHVQSTLMTQQLQQSCRSQVLVLTWLSVGYSHGVLHKVPHFIPIGKDYSESPSFILYERVAISQYLIETVCSHSYK